MDSCIIELAVQEQVQEITAIYQSLKGTPGCTWTEDYPSIEDVEADIQKESLYIVREDGKIVAAAAAGKDEELQALPCWQAKIKQPCNLSRVGVLQTYQSRGIAKRLIRRIEKDAPVRGFDGIHFLVGRANHNALALYKSLHYQCCGEAYMYGMDWYCYEKRLGDQLC